MAVYHNSYQIPDDAKLASFNFEKCFHLTELPQPTSSRLTGILTDILKNPLKYRNTQIRAQVHNNDGYLPGNTGDGTFSISLEGVVEGEGINSYTVEQTDKRDYRTYVYDLIEVPITYSGSDHTFTSQDGWIFRAIVNEEAHVSGGGAILKKILEKAAAIEWAPSFTVEDITFFTNILKQEVEDYL